MRKRQSESGISVEHVRPVTAEADAEIFWHYRRRNPELEAESQVITWRTLVVNEIHAALCTRKNYRKQVADLKRNANVLIIAIAGFIAAKLAIAVGVISALVASVLRFVLSMGVSVFCKRKELSQ